MNEKEREIIGRDMIRMYDSLHQAVLHAGGTGSNFSPQGIESMIVLELISHLAPNGVRFYCNKTHELVRIHKPTVDPRQCKGKFPVEANDG